VDAFSGARIRIRLEGLEITGSTSGIVVTADQAEILDCRVHDLAPGPSSVGISVDAFGGRVLDNLIQNIPGGGMLIRGFRAGEIRRNVVRNFGSSLTAIGIGVADSVVLGNTGGAVIADNTVSSLPDGTDDTGMWIETNNNLVTGNTASRNGATGIWMPGSRNRIERNVANQNGVDGLGFSTAQDGNFVVSNESQGNTGCGLRLQGSNVLYRDNLFSDNLGGNVCGTAGTNAGGNYCNLALCP
jgi:parallel beta-helix repeat protein